MKTLIIILAVFTSFVNLAVATSSSAILTVVVTDFQNRPRVKDQIVFESKRTGKQYTCVTDSKGRAELNIPDGDTYTIKYRDFFDTTTYNNMEIPPSNGGQLTAKLTIQYEPAKEFTLKNLLFDFSKATVRTVSYQILDQLVELMKLKNTLVIEVAGHTDNIGSDESNKKLSKARADAVKQYLIGKGIAATRISTQGYGADRPVALNDSDSNRQLNRRTEVRIIKE